MSAKSFLKYLSIALVVLSDAMRLEAAPQSTAMQAYLAVKQDSGLYVGEGSAAFKDLASLAKALEAARERARASLAESVSVEISSETSEHLQSEDGKSSEKIESRTHSQAHLVLDNIKFLELKEFPDKDQVTVLASLSKEDYRRQLAGKAVAVYSLERAFRLNLLAGGPLQSVGRPGSRPGLGASLFWRNWLLGLDYLPFKNYKVDEVSKGKINVDGEEMAWSTLSLGYDLTPWPGRFRPYLPLRIHYCFASADPYATHLFGASAGVGLRYWVNDSVGIDTALLGTVGLNKAQFFPIRGGSNPPVTLYDSSGNPVDLDLGGARLEIGLFWSGF